MTLSKRQTALLAVLAYTDPIPTVAYAVGDLHRRDIAGIWRLTSKMSFQPKLVSDVYLQQHVLKYPMKEFTVYPKKASPPPPVTNTASVIKEEEILLMLSEDGKFVQYGAINSSYNKDDGAHESEMANLRQQQNLQQAKKEAGYQSKFGNLKNTDDKMMKERYYGSVMGLTNMKGTWAFLDGTLILAADRPLTTDAKLVHDTILVGRVVATSRHSLLENPALAATAAAKAFTNSSLASFSAEDLNSTSLSSSPANSMDRKSTTDNNKPVFSLASKNDFGANTHCNLSSSSSTLVDVHLAVPEGSVEIGKFMYPKKHPSFFEQPIFKPVPTGSFSLCQILGTLNTRLEEPEPKEKFNKQDLMGKRYFLTSFPLPNKRKKKQRWSIKYNKMVDANPTSDKDKKREMEDEATPIPIRTFELELFANNTFATVAGLGGTVLRGKWWIVGNERDQFWMQVWRFGFGRFVSGSTYSEGIGLTQKDEVAYWGMIYEVHVSETEVSVEADPTQSKEKKIEVNGSVMDGWGLEPCSVAKFTMVEKTEGDDYYDDDDDDEEDDDNDIDQETEIIDSFSNRHIIDDDDDDPSAFE